jgi:HSP20 family protein
MLVHVRKRPRFDFATLERDVDRIFRGFSSERGVPASYGFNVTPDENGVTVRADVPGVEPSAINVAVNGRALTISGARSMEKRGDGAQEHSSVKFSRTLYLSEDLDSQAIDAECRNGVLTLRIAKRPEAKPRQIEVTSS